MSLELVLSVGLVFALGACLANLWLIWKLAQLIGRVIVPDRPKDVWSMLEAYEAGRDSPSELTYRAKRALEDLQAVDTRAFLLIQDNLQVIQNALERRREIVGQIRNGTYDESGDNQISG